MKRTYNLISEIISLPFSGLFLYSDPILEAIRISRINEPPFSRGDRLHRLSRAFEKKYLDITEYLNSHTDVISLTMVKSAFDCIFDSQRIIQHISSHSDKSQEEQVCLYYAEMLEEISSFFLTVRNGKICLRIENNAEDFKSKKTSVFSPFRVENIDNSFQQVELWNSLLRCLPEELIICSYVAQQAQASSDIGRQRHVCEQLLLKTGATIPISDLLLDKVLEKGLAETHLHAGASRNYGVIWNDLLCQAYKHYPVLEKEEYKFPFKENLSQSRLHSLCAEAATVQFILAAFLASSCSNFTDYLKSNPFTADCNRFIRCEINEIYATNQPRTLLNTFISPTGVFLRHYVHEDEMELWRILGISAERNTYCPTLAHKCLLSWSLLHIMKREEDTAFIALFLYYIRIFCNVYRTRIQDSKSPGLEYFQKYYDASTDTGSLTFDAKLHEILYAAISDTRVVKTELRFSPPTCTAPTLARAVPECEKIIKSGIEALIKSHVFILATLYSQNDECSSDFNRLFELYWRDEIRRIKSGERDCLRHLLQVTFEVRLEQIQAHRIGVIYHLIKHGETFEKNSCAIDCLSARSEHDQFAALSFGEARFQYQASILAIQRLRKKYPELCSLLVGIDAASLEIPTEPWVFAPTFQIARTKDSILCYSNHPFVGRKQLGVTYHVGEDFRYPLSGLRHVYESIQYLTMTTGDRIGHGLVLGINMDDWFYKNHLVIMPRIEWLENNLWVWDLISREPELSSLSQYLNEIKRHIFSAARSIYGTLDGISLETLLYSYKAKFSSVDNLIDIAKKELSQCHEKPDCFQQSDVTKGLPCLCMQKNEDHINWSENTLILSYHCGVFKQRMSENVLFCPSSAQAEITNRLQEFMRKRVSSLGLIIEANPSSNAVIREMDGILMHPIHQFREESDSHMMVSINTDDPSVFNATVANEYSQVYYALRHQGRRVEDALKEIDLIRRIGMETSFLDTPPSIEQLLLEYEAVLRSLD